MKTPSNEDEEGPRAGAGLPISLDRRIRPWRYSVSHSELSLRSIDSGPSDDIIEIKFIGVVGMKLKTMYEMLHISHASGPQREEILAFVGVPEAHAPKVQCLTLNPDDDSFVACLRISIWARPRDAQHDSSGLPQSESTLIYRG